MRRSLIALLVVVAAVGLVGCNDGDDVAAEIDPETQRLIAETERALEGYWAEHIASVTAKPYAPPREVEVYTNSVFPKGSECIAPDDARWRDNSFYCPPDGALYLNADWLRALGSAFQQPDIAAVILHGHEFGHHLQELAGDKPKLEVGTELQADCYAGVFLSALAAERTTLDIGDVNAREALNTLRNIADTDFADAAWFEPGRHGGPIQRAAAMATGYLTEDARFCEGYEQTGPIRPMSIGSYRFRPPPAATFSRLEGGALRMKIAAQPDLTTDVTEATSLPSGAVQALQQLAPRYFDGSSVRYVDDVDPFDARPEGLDIASLRYDQVQAGRQLHGALILVTRGDGSALVLDAFEDGPAPPADDHDAWQLVGNYAFSALWGITE